MANKDYSKVSGKCIKITAVYQKALSKFTNCEAKKDGFENFAEFKAYWEKNIGEWKSETIVWVHEFCLTEK